MGNSNSIQPHAFLPPEFIGNERLRCSSDFLAPLNLNPWVERDPFHKDGDFISSNQIQTGNDVFANEILPTTRPTIIDTERPVLITARPTKKTTISNNLDFPSTTTRPTKRRTTTRRHSPTVIDNKIDFDIDTTTKRIDSPFSKLAKNSKNATKIVKRSTTAKLSSKKKRKRPQDPAEPRSDDSTDSTDKTATEPFVNDDNATTYVNNNPIRPGHYKAVKSVETRASFDNENQYDRYRPSYDYTSRPSTYYPIYPPLTEPPNNRRPVIFMNNRPNYQNYDEKRPLRPTQTPISSIHMTPFSYDTFENEPKPMLSQNNYETNQAIPLFISQNKISKRPTYDNFYRPTYPTTRKIDLTTFLFVETTRKIPTFGEFMERRTTQNPFFSTKLDYDYQLSYSTQSPYDYEPVAVPSSIDNSDDDLTNLSYFISSSNINKFSTKRPTHENPKPFSTDIDPPSIFSHDDTDDSSDETESEDNDFDGYLRPETNFYVPITTQQKPSYNDYSIYNYKPETFKTNTKFYYVKNVLHKFEGKSNDDALYEQEPTKRYAELYDKHLIEKSSADKLRTMTDGVKLEGRSRLGSENIFLVPFKLLTKIERPDNWVNTDTTLEQDKTTLPDVPALRQDSHVAQELPRPIFGKRRAESLQIRNKN